MNNEIIQTQIIITAVVVLWFDVFDLGEKLKRALYKEPLKRAEISRPFNCRLCTHFWLGSIISFGYYFVTWDANLLINLLSLNTVISYAYERI